MQADKWGPVGAVVMALLYLEVDWAITAMEVMALDFLLTDVVILPVLAAFLGVTLWVLWGDRRYHRDMWPARVGLAAALLTFGALWVGGELVAVGIAILVGAVTWNWVLLGQISERRLRARRKGSKGA